MQSKPHKELQQMPTGAQIKLKYDRVKIPQPEFAERITC